METTKLLKEYYNTKKALDILEKDLDVLKVQLMEVLKQTDEKLVLPGMATFYVQAKRIYQYSAKVEEMGVSLSKMKKIEELDGTATVKTTSYFPVMKTLKGGE